MELGWGGFDRAKLDMLILIRIPFSFHVLSAMYRRTVFNCVIANCEFVLNTQN